MSDRLVSVERDPGVTLRKERLPRLFVAPLAPRQTALGPHSRPVVAPIARHG